MTGVDDVLAAAGRLLAARPAATMDEVAAEAGVSRATLFRRFPSRTALVTRLCHDGAARYVAAVDAAAPEDGQAPEALRRLLAGLAALAPQYGLLLLQPLPDYVEAELLSGVEATDRRVRELVLRGQAAGHFRVDLPAEWVLTAVTWLIAGAADGLRLGTLAPRDVERLVTQTVLGALRPPPSAPGAGAAHGVGGVR